MVIKGKTEGIVRLIGSILILICFVLSLLSDIMASDNLLFSLFYFLISVILLILSLLIKAEITFITKYKIFIISFTLVLASLVIVFASVSNLEYINFMFMLISLISLIICWHFSLSIYRKRKITYGVTGFLFLFLRLIFINLNVLLPIQIVIILLGMLMIIIAEEIMKKKDLLNYI